MKARALVEMAVAGPLRTLRDLQAMPDDQLYTCADTSVAERHKIAVPFQCGCRQWVGGGLALLSFTLVATQQRQAVAHSIRPVITPTFARCTR